MSRGELPRQDIPPGDLTSLGDVKVELSKLPAPARYTLVVKLAKCLQSPQTGSGGAPLQTIGIFGFIRQHPCLRQRRKYWFARLGPMQRQGWTLERKSYSSQP